MSDASDRELLQEYAVHNSEPAFAELVQRHINLVHSVALRCVNEPQDAQDVTQAVFILLARKAGRWREKTVLTGWLYETTRFTAMKFLRTTARRRIREQEGHMRSTLNESNTGSVWQQISPLLEEAMTRLSEKDRTLLALRFYENKSSAHAAAALGLKEWAARKRTERAVDRLRAFFVRRGIRISASVLVAAVSANSLQATPISLTASVTAVAVTKGAAASTTTLTLIQGALKLMAWTKAKTAIVVGTAIILAAGTTTMVVKHQTLKIPEAWWQPDWESYKKIPALVAVRRAKPNLSESTVLDDRVQKFIGQSLSPKFLFAYAYFFVDTRMILPYGLAAQRFDVILTVPDHQQAKLQQELRHKLGYTGVVKKVTRDVFLLQVKSVSALKLKIATDTDQPKTSPTSPTMVLKNAPISQLAATLESRFDKPVLDQTGLTNHYDLILPNPFRTNSQGGHGVSPETAQQELLQMLDEAGLELVPSREAIEMLVVEKVK